MIKTVLLMLAMATVKTREFEIEDDILVKEPLTSSIAGNIKAPREVVVLYRRVRLDAPGSDGA
jgi:hypothetical protein